MAAARLNRTRRISHGCGMCKEPHQTIAVGVGSAELSERIEIIVSELTTNALKASQAMDSKPPFRLWLLSDKRSVLVLVWDANPRPPIRLNGSPEDEGGRGVLLVESISDKWDWHRHPETGGKVVWALCEIQISGS